MNNPAVCKWPMDGNSMVTKIELYVIGQSMTSHNDCVVNSQESRHHADQ